MVPSVQYLKAPQCKAKTPAEELQSWMKYYYPICTDSAYLPSDPVQQHDPAWVSIQVSVLPAGIDQPPVTGLVCHHTAMAWTFKGAVQAIVIPAQTQT